MGAWAGHPLTMSFPATSGGFIPNCRLDLVGEFWGNFVDVMNGAGVFGGLLQDILLGVALGYVVAAGHEIGTAQYLRHRGLLY